MEKELHVIRSLKLINELQIQMKKYKGVPKIVCKRIIIENKQKMVQLKENTEIKCEKYQNC